MDLELNFQSILPYFFFTRWFQIPLFIIIRYYQIMKKLQSGDEIVKIDEKLGIAWILLPPDDRLGGFRGISPRIVDEEKFMAAKNKPEEEKR
jgi:hypothetical protein